MAEYNLRKEATIVNRTDKERPHNHLGMEGVSAGAGAVPPFQRGDQLGEIQLLVDLDQQMVGVNEVPQAVAGQLEKGGVPAAAAQRPSGSAAQRLKHPHSSQMIECTPTVAQGWQVCRYADFFNKPFSAPLTPALCESQGFQYSDES